MPTSSKAGRVTSQPLPMIARYRLPPLGTSGSWVLSDSSNVSATSIDASMCGALRAARLQEWCNWVLDTGYNFDEHIGPHDTDQHNLIDGKTRYDLA